jgi:hypothetical protein
MKERKKERKNFVGKFVKGPIIIQNGLHHKIPIIRLQSLEVLSKVNIVPAPAPYSFSELEFQFFIFELTFCLLYLSLSCCCFLTPEESMVLGWV